MRELSWKSTVELVDNNGNSVSFDSLDDKDCAKIADAIRRGFECGRINVNY